MSQFSSVGFLDNVSDGHRRSGAQASSPGPQAALAARDIDPGDSPDQSSQAGGSTSLAKDSLSLGSGRGSQGALEPPPTDAPAPAEPYAVGRAQVPAAPASPGSVSATQLLLMLPDIEPAFARQTVDSVLAKGFTSRGQILDQAMDVLFAMTKGYPKTAGRDKRKRTAGAGADDEAEIGVSKKPCKVDRINYGDPQRRRGHAPNSVDGKVYDELSIAALSEDFGLVPIPQ